ncbi:dTDP-4-dehydrorhamnose reductase [Williamsia sp.]|uniref:dTDP-4-dehydrorhamnose reductase n=1 Tax=Williamsia sp. TaxID=1872085 RepID=UPI001A3088C6|nr:dTDP-4-dehydrorhamnose reductase [Williamsia sp.]MBJ7288228.1 dTDP-4-dehydrorhamnose reductase [Williamsia sp.]
MSDQEGTGVTNSTRSGRLIVTGAGGQVGRLLADTPGAVGLGHADLDISDADAVRRVLADLAPDDVVVNCAAYTAVDAAETDVAAAESINVAGPAALAGATAAAGAWLIHLSTDYVFSGDVTRDRPLEPADLDPDATPATVYGRTKLDGERAARSTDPRTTIVRTAWVYTGAVGGSDFVSTMRRLEVERDTIGVVDDQIGSPTYAVDLAAALHQLAQTPPEHMARVVGTALHATNAGRCSWFDLAQAVFAGLGADPDRVRPVTTAEFPRPAPRPAYSVLSGVSWADAGLRPLREWRPALDVALHPRSLPLPRDS